MQELLQGGYGYLQRRLLFAAQKTVWVAKKCKNTNTVPTHNTVLVAVLRPPVTPQRSAVQIKAYIGGIRNPLGVVPGTNAYYFLGTFPRNRIGMQPASCRVVSYVLLLCKLKQSA